ncbi:hypothetical protein NL676_019454, partial [Syzygium grande]
MSNEPKHPYPPLYTGGCTEPVARVDGEDGKKAKAIIEKENPQVTGVIMAPGTSYILDTC